MSKIERVTWILGGIGFLGSIGLIYVSFRFDGWQHDVLLNSGFVILGALFTAIFVDQIVKLHEESKWNDARKSAWQRVRRVTTGLVGNVAIYFPDPKMTLNSPSKHYRFSSKDRLWFSWQIPIYGSKVDCSCSFGGHCQLSKWVSRS